MNFEKMSKKDLVKELKKLYNERPTGNSPKEIAVAFRYELKKQKRRDQELLMVAILDGDHRIIEIKTIFIGTANYTTVHPREIFKFAVENSAVAIIMAHNHPSNKLKPSEQDTAITERISRCGDMLGIELLDHIIISDTGYFSYKENFPAYLN